MTLLEHAPRLTVAAAEAVVRELYGIEASASTLPSERDQNFFCANARGERFTLKIANATESRALLEAQNAAMAHAAPTGLCPRPLPSRAGRDIESIPNDAGASLFVRVLTWIPGVPLGRVPRRSPALLDDLGRRVGDLDRALAGFDHPAAHRDFHWDLASGAAAIRQRAALVGTAEVRALVLRVAEDADRHAAAQAALRRSVVHNDLNDYNVLVNDDGELDGRHQRVTGILDFGDMVYDATVADLAVAIAYAILGSRDPLGAAAAVVQGYHRAFPLEDAEVGELWRLVRLRLAMSVAIAADQMRQRPGDPYLAISQSAVERMLPVLMNTPPALAEARFRYACGWPVSRTSASALRRLASASPGPLLDIDLATPIVLDLSVASPLVEGDPRANAEPRLTPRLEMATTAPGRAGAVAIGRYGEPRLLYTSPLFGTPLDEPRTIHLGIDLFAPAGTSVFVPLAGVVHAFADNAAALDYGPVVIVAHATDAGTFYTLYGHLSRTSLRALRAGQRLEAGERVGWIGSAGENGGWTPHLHFQVLLELLDLGTDVPGVCRASERRFWTAVSPDPSALARLPASASVAPADVAETVAARRRHVGGSVRLSYREPLRAARGWMQYLFDASGRRYLDAYNNVPHVGHAHPAVVETAAAQMRVLNTNTRYATGLLARYAERLAGTLPDPLSVCFFVNSGSEANELALRLARTHTGQRDVIVLDGAYHGNTTTLAAMSPYKFNGPGGRGAPEWVYVASLPDVYRGPYKKDDPEAGMRYAASVAERIADLRDRGGGLAAYIAESAPSVGGQIVLPPGYLPAVYHHVRAAGGVCVADEVQTAYGRMGTHFYAFEAQHVVPDIVVLGKPIGNGHPIGAVVTTREIAGSFDDGMEFFSTFGGNTVSCAVGIAVLDVVEREGLQGHAQRVGERLLGGLRDLAARHALIGDVRGSGLFVGVELVRDRETLEPAAAEAAFITNRLRDDGILVGTEGACGDVIKIRPPMPFDERNADEFIEAFDRILTECR
ncbi:MAG TPA: aminotransferase class III-fold pyridoxal phosphate-dependent enzyme [Vicinamibacterales bacterium]|nr:aminotransferase class III-fold pyridoxal phosphate-dependent enzyme [Vicinamibacterales bacterium]